MANSEHTQPMGTLTPDPALGRLESQRQGLLHID
jgi:hypothetical protein